MIQATRKGTPWRWIAGGSLAAVLVALGVCEALGWPFLAAPMQRALGDALGRRVSLSADSAAPPKGSIHLLGGIRIAAAHIEIGAPTWSNAPYMLLARDARMTLGYADLWRASRGEALRIRELRAASLDGHIERRADGRASWQFGKNSDVPDTSDTPTKVPVFGHLQVDSGGLRYSDALMAIELDAKYSLVEGSNISSANVQGSGTATGLVFDATGTYRKQPLRIELQTSGVLPVLADGADVRALPIKLEARVGGARLSFQGTATDALRLTALKGRFSLQGASLAATGAPLGVTLPTTAPFRAEGSIAKQGVVWNTVVDSMAIGATRLNGAFTYDPRPAVPVLAGRLGGSKLLLADLGPAVGTPARASSAVADAMPVAAAKKSGAAGRMVLPDREFDLPALRAMNANVLIDIANLDLGSSILEPLKPLRTHLVLANGVLTLRELEARTGQGRLFGTVQLDGRNAQALWTADLRWDGVRLESWVKQSRADNAPPYVTGNLAGQARVAGQGKSTAAILGSMRGAMRMQVSKGTISHLAVEAAGLDVAQAIGMLIKGDDSLPIDCTVIDLGVEQGVLKPRVFVLDTPDSTIWVDGSISLATEALDLRMVTTPRDFSPLALRTPVILRGTFANPSVSVEAGKLATRLGASALLALINPLAAIIPLMDIGDSADAKRSADACRALSQRIAAKPVLPAPAAAKATRPPKGTTPR